MQILDTATLEAILTPDDLSGIATTIDEGHWGGMPVPGSEGWVQPAEGPCDRLCALAIHYYTARHPDADHTLIAIAAGVLHGGATGWGSPYPVDEDPRYDRADAWLLAIAGGYPAPPGELGNFALTPPINSETGKADVPGGRVALTRLAVEFLDRLLFVGEASARVLADEYLAAHAPDPLAGRAMTIFGHVQRWQYEDLSPIRCFDCGATGLEHWYTSREGGYSLCPPCFDRRAAGGRAKESQP